MTLEAGQGAYEKRGVEQDLTASVFWHRDVRTVLDTSEQEVRGRRNAGPARTCWSASPTTPGDADLARGSTLREARVRSFEGLDVIFMVMRAWAENVVTTGGFEWPDPGETTKALLLPAAREAYLDLPVSCWKGAGR
jgi:hypothetical protein